MGGLAGAKILRDGKVLITCKDTRQRDKALKLHSLGGKSITASLFRESARLRGVITGVPLDVTVDQIKKSLTGGRVGDVIQLKGFRDGVRSDSMSVMIQFEGVSLPEKVFGIHLFPSRGLYTSASEMF